MSMQLEGQKALPKAIGDIAPVVGIFSEKKPRPVLQRARRRELECFLHFILAMMASDGVPLSCARQVTEANRIFLAFSR